MNRKARFTIIAAAAALAAASCKGPGNPAPDSADSAYAEGRDAAIELARTWQGDSAAAGRAILDVVARADALGAPVLTDEMRRGFRDGLTEADPPLAAAIF